MSSNDSLYGLAAHLQTMEINLTDFIFECALRLSAMTDSRVFVLMDNPNLEGRRFCGNPELVREFLERGLRSQRIDAEIELNADSPPVRPKGTKRSYEDLLFNGASGADVGVTKCPDVDVKRRRCVPTTATADAAATNTPSGESDGKNGRELSVELSCKSEIEEFYIDSDSDVQEGDEKLDTSARFINETSFMNETSFSVTAGSSNDIASIDGFSSLMGGAGTDLLVSDDDTPSRKIHLDSPNLRLKEIACFRIGSPVLAFVKGTMENKLIASIFYDAGKALTQTNPYPVDSLLFRQYFRQRLDEYVDCFDVFKVPVTSEMTALYAKESNVQTYTPESFMKMNARNGHRRAAAHARSGQTNVSGVS